MKTSGIRYTKQTDCDEIVQVHLASFKGFFLSFLGSRFLRVFYSSLISDDKSIAFVSENGGQIGGFVVGSMQPNGFYSRLLRRDWWRFGWAAFPAYVRQPTIFPRLLHAFRMPKQELPAENCATLMSIAVDPVFQGQGIGKLLVKAFLDEARSRGSQYVNLTTDAVDNDAANHFYQSLGFEQVRQYTTPEGRSMNEYLIKVV
jgi:ribosomal protein S18 acetylase RimI-like enzyme